MIESSNAGFLVGHSVGVPHGQIGGDVEKLLLSPEEAAEALGVGRSRVYDLIRTRQLLSVRIGRSRRVPVAAVHA